MSPAEAASHRLGPIVYSNPEPSDEFNALKLHRAEAIAYASSETEPSDLERPPQIVRYRVEGLPSPAQAASAALEACEEARAQRPQPTYVCELRRRDFQGIHSTWELSRGLAPDRPAFLWRITEGTNTVYLAGSIHVLKPTLRAPPSYFDAFSEANALALELNPRQSTPERIQRLMQRYALLPRGTTLESLLSPADYAAATTYLSKMGIEPLSANLIKPAMLLLQASALEYQSIGYLPDYGIEKVLEDKLGNRALLGLETMEQQLDAATALPLNLQAQLLSETIREADSIAIQISSLVRAWLSGDADYLSEQFENSTASAAAVQWMDDLLAKRNIGMAQAISALLSGTDPRLPKSTDQVVFVLVGAAHLVGENSVIELLGRQGIKTQRLRHGSLSPSD